MKLPFCLPLDDSHFKNGESMNSQLEQEVNLKLGSLSLRPVWVVPVNFRTLTTTTDDGREPILLSEKYVSDNGCE